MRLSPAMAGFTPALVNCATASVVQPTVTGSGFDPSLALHGFTGRRLFLVIHERPRSGLPAGVLARVVLTIVVFREPALKIVGLPDVTPAGRFAPQHIDVEWQPPRVGLEPTT